MSRESGLAWAVSSAPAPTGSSLDTSSSLDCHPLICGLTLVRRCAIVMLPWLSEARPFLPKVLIETLRSPFGLKGTAVLSFVWQICYSNGVKSGAGLHVLVSVGQRLRFCIRSPKGRPSPHISSVLDVVKTCNLETRLTSSPDYGIVALDSRALECTSLPVCLSPW